MESHLPARTGLQWVARRGDGNAAGLLLFRESGWQPLPVVPTFAAGQAARVVSHQFVWMARTGHRTQQAAGHDSDCLCRRLDDIRRVRNAVLAPGTGRLLVESLGNVA